MRSVMALFASRNASARRARRQQFYIASTSPPTQYGKKRHCSSAAPSKSPAANRCWRWKRPRTSRGRPHANFSVLVSSSPSAEEEEEEEASSSTSFVCGEKGYCASTVPSPCEATSFVKTKPLQHLATIKMEKIENYDDDCALRQVPTVFPAREHLVLSCTAAGISERLSFSGQTHMFTTLSWPDSPLNRTLTAQEISSEQMCSSFTEELSGDDQVEQLNWNEALHDDGSCEFLSERFYHIEEDLKCIMGESRHGQHSCHETIGEQYRSKPLTSALTVKAAEFANCQGVQIAARTESLMTLTPAQMVQKMEDFGAHEKQQTVAKEEINVIDSPDCSALSSSASEEDYRIDLVDFEPLVEEQLQEQFCAVPSLTSASGSDGHLHRHTFESTDEAEDLLGAGDHHCGAEGVCALDTITCHFKLALSLNYEAVLSAWRDRGSPFVDGVGTDGAFDSLSTPDDHPPLILQAWQPGNANEVSLSLRPEELMLPEASRMILICPADDGTCVGDDAGQMDIGMSGKLRATTSSSSTSTARQRHARVLRYREKRRTRLFSKTIRYEVRKLNAERRPRMKGRFIKRTTDQDAKDFKKVLSLAL